MLLIWRRLGRVSSFKPVSLLKSNNLSLRPPYLHLCLLCIALDISVKKSTIQQAHAKGAVVTVSLGGATDSPFSHDPYSLGQQVSSVRAYACVRVRMRVRVRACIFVRMCV
jgi:hypothetical protein